MNGNFRIYAFVGGMFLTLIAGILCSNLIVKFFGHIPYLKYSVLGVSLVCIATLFFLQIEDLALFTLYASIFLAWLNKALFRDT
jgi:hypothetical protein